MRRDRASQRQPLREQGAILKDWGGRVPIALIYPNTYYVGMSNLGLHTIYSALNAYDDIVCERAFRGWEGKSVESGRPLDDFAVLAFSISSELDYFNVAHILKSSRTPLLAAERGEAHPLVIAGGPCVSANPEPLAPFLDCLAIGEGEAILPSLIKTLAEGLEDSREARLRALSAIPGVYVSALHQSDRISRQWMRDIDGFATTSTIITTDTELGGIYLIEATRGCRWGCRFCLAGHLFRPFRFRSIDNLLLQAEEGLKRSKRIGLLGACVSDHPQIDELAIALRRMGAELSVSSLRVRPLSPALLKALAEGGAKSVTLAPEAGSERLRRVVNKGVTEDDIMSAADKVMQTGFRQLKLYFMVGLPTETDEDIEEMVRLCLAIKGRLDRGGTHLVLSVEPFVPKAGTPFQRLAMADAATLKPRIATIKSALAPKGIEVRTESVGWAAVQCALSRGGRELAAALADMEVRSLSAWRQTLAEHDIDSAQYIGREIPPDERLPWDHLDCGVSSQYLEEEMERARRGDESPPCPIGESIECHKCGVC